MAVVHNDAGILQVEVIVRIDEAIAIPTNSQRKILNNGGGAFKIGHAQRGGGVLAASNGAEALHYGPAAHGQGHCTAHQHRHKGLTAEKHAKGQQHGGAGQPVAAAIGIKQAQRC